MQMRFRRARAITIAGFSSDSAPVAASSSNISLDDWVADQPGAQPTKGHVVRLRFLDAGGVDLLGGSVSFQVWGKTISGFWVADAAHTGAASTGRYTSNLIGDLYIEVTAIDITGIPTAVTMEIWVQEAAQ